MIFTIPIKLCYDTGNYIVKFLRKNQAEVIMQGISEMISRMIDFYDGNLHDIDHFIKVWAYAKTIGELEHLDEETQFILETAAIVHDIACPLCREKYGNADGKHQETEGPALTADFLKDTGMNAAQMDRVSFLVGHHHTLNNIEGIDYQILIEADYIVNAGESSYSVENIADFDQKFFKTQAGHALLHSVFVF